MPRAVIAADSSWNTVIGQSTSYATARATATDHVWWADRINIGQQRFNAPPTTYRIWRGFLKFSLASIPAGAQIQRVFMTLVATSDVSDLNDFDVRILKLDWSAQDPIGAGNRDTAYDNNLAATLDAVWRNTSGMSTNTLYDSPDLDTTRLTPGGNVYYGINSSRDVGNNAPGSDGNEYIELAAPNYATVGYRPTLTVDYSTGSGVLLLAPDGMMM